MRYVAAGCAVQNLRKLLQPKFMRVCREQPRRRRTSTRNRLLPHPASVCAHHRLTVFASEGLLECGGILHRSLDAPLPRGMRIGLCALARLLVGNVLAPDLSVGQEETLLGCVAINLLGRCTTQ